MLYQCGVYLIGYVTTPFFEWRNLRDGPIPDNGCHREVAPDQGVLSFYNDLASKIFDSLSAASRLTGFSNSDLQKLDVKKFNFELWDLYSINSMEFIVNSACARVLSKKIERLLLVVKESYGLEEKLMEGAIVTILLQIFREMNIKDHQSMLALLDVKLCLSIEKLFFRNKWLNKDGKTLTVSGSHIFSSRIDSISRQYQSLLIDMRRALSKSSLKSPYDCPNETTYCEESKISSPGFSGVYSDEHIPDLRSSLCQLLHVDVMPIRTVNYVGHDVDCVQKLLKEAAKHCQDKEFESFTYRLMPEVYSPLFLRSVLSQRSGSDKDAVVYFQSFVSHSLTIDPNEDIDSSLELLATAQAKYTISPEKRVIDALTLLSTWQQYFQVWAEVIKERNLVLIDSHSYPALGTEEERVAGLSSNLINIPYQCAITADAQLILAARVGLFCMTSPKRFPINSDICLTAIYVFEKRNYCIRHASLNDLDRLYELESLCWKHTQTPGDIIQARLKKYPSGQFVLEKNGKVLGVIYSQRIADVDVLDKYSAATVHELHNTSGSIAQLLAVNIDPGEQQFGYGDQLLEFILQVCGLTAGIKRVVGVTLCKGFNQKEGEVFDDYIKREGANQDPVLSFHQNHGAVIVKAIRGYRPEDLVNQGNGVLVSYDIFHRKKALPDEMKEKDPTNKHPHLPQSEIEGLIQHKIVNLLKNQTSNFDFERPLMEMGLDSADLLTLHQLIQEIFSINLKPAFFFEYNTARKVVSYLNELHEISSGSNGVYNTTAENIVYAGLAASTQKREQKNKRVNKDTNYALRRQIRETDIAVIGMSCKLPGGIETPDQFWQTLVSGSSNIRSYPRSRGRWPTHQQWAGIDQGGFIHDADTFDASFFRVSPAEAIVTDPQQRILLQLAWKCFEEAAVLPNDLKGTNTGVFIGASNCDYSRLIQESRLETQAHHSTGSSLAVLANRLSYFFDLSGPSLLVDTACSASLVAVHMAIQSLNSGECPIALAGGANFICYPDLSVSYHKAGMLSPDARCRVFDEQANGYVRSEGAVLLLLKPLEHAILDKNRIHAVIRGSAINHGGLAGGLTVPNPKKQSELLVSAWNRSGILPKDLGYIEAHGTGTALGDPIEIQGIQTANKFYKPEQRVTSCALGSAKSNLGHLESAAGATGLLKTILSLKHRHIPASINFDSLNKKILLDNESFYIARDTKPWSSSTPRFAGVSSFGSGGTNAHVVVEEWGEDVRKERMSAQNSLFVLSAKSEERLNAYVASILHWISKCSNDISFADFIFTYQTGRSEFDERLAIETTSFQDLNAKLHHWLESGCNGRKDIWQDNVREAYEKLLPLLEDGIGEQVLTRAYTDKNLKQLGVMWVSGFTVDFKKLYTLEPQPISAPSYPFADTRFWVNPKDLPPMENTFLGSGKNSSEGYCYTKLWNSFPSSLLFTQKEFSCLSLGFILEVFLSAADEVRPDMPISEIRELKYYPFLLKEGSTLHYKTLCTFRGQNLFVSLMHISNEGEVIIAEANLAFLVQEMAAPFKDVNLDGANWIVVQEKNSYSVRLPMETLKYVFPLLVSSTSRVVEISRIMFHQSLTFLNESSLQVMVRPGDISVFSGEKNAFLSIH